MAHTNQPISPAEIVRVLRQYHRRWLIPAIAGGILALVYALTVVYPWQASQTLVVRDEALNGPDSPGRFRLENEMKTTQETILEVARSRGVVARALKQVGPPADYKKPAAWPSDEDIADLQSAIRLTPPKGAEFGKTEVFFLQIENRDRPRALAIVSAVCRELQNGLAELRDAKAASLISELTKALTLAEADLNKSTSELKQIEQQVGGSDLADLRMLDQTGAGDSDLRRKLISIDTELREARSVQRANDELLRALQTGQQDAGFLVAAPNRLLESQPALRRLKDGLVDAQIRTALLLGTRSENHPEVRAARAVEAEMSGHLHKELEIAVRGVEMEQRLTAGKIEFLEKQLADTTGRLDRLAGLRADYSNLFSASRHHNTMVEKARRDLADARAARAGAHSGSLLSLVDEATTGTKPVGPRKALIVMAGLVGGLALGLGIVFLTVPPLGPTRPHHAQPQRDSLRNGSAGSATTATSSGHGLSLNQALRKVAPGSLE